MPVRKVGDEPHEHDDCEHRIKGFALHPEGDGFGRNGMFACKFNDEDPKLYESLCHSFDNCEELEIIFDDRDARTICQVSTEV